MGNEEARLLGAKNSRNITDEVIRAQAGLPNSYTPRPIILGRFYDKMAQRKERRYRDHLASLYYSRDESMTKQILKYLKAFAVGGLIGTIMHHYSDVYGDIQYFPFRKLEEYIGENKRLSFYTAR